MGTTKHNPNTHKYKTVNAVRPLLLSVPWRYGDGPPMECWGPPCDGDDSPSFCATCCKKRSVSFRIIEVVDGDEEEDMSDDRSGLTLYALVVAFVFLVLFVGLVLSVSKENR